MQIQRLLGRKLFLFFCQSQEFIIAKKLRIFVQVSASHQANKVAHHIPQLGTLLFKLGGNIFYHGTSEGIISFWNSYYIQERRMAAFKDVDITIPAEGKKDLWVCGDNVLSLLCCASRCHKPSNAHGQRSCIASARSGYEDARGVSRTMYLSIA